MEDASRLAGATARSDGDAPPLARGAPKIARKEFFCSSKPSTFVRKDFAAACKPSRFVGRARQTARKRSEAVRKESIRAGKDRSAGW